MELELGNMTLSEGIEETWKMMKSKQKSMEETLGHVKERVDDTIGSYETFLAACGERDEERNRHRSVFVKDEGNFDYSVDNWRRHNKKELAAEVKQMDFLPEIRKSIEALSGVHPGYKPVMEDIVVDFLRMQVHNSLVSEQTVQPLEDVRIWITGLESDDKNQAPPVNSRVTRLYDDVKSNLGIVKKLQEHLIKLSEFYTAASSKEHTAINDCVAVITEKEKRLRQREMPEDLTVVDKIGTDDLMQKSLAMMSEVSEVEETLKELKSRHKEADQKIAEKKDLYLYVLEMEAKNEKYERNKTVEESGPTMEAEFLTKVFNVFDNLYTKSLAQLLQADKTETARTTQIRSEIADMVKVSGSAIRKESISGLDVPPDDKPIKCQDEHLLENIKLFIEQLKLFRSDVSKIHTATQTNITEEISTLKQIKPSIQDKEIELISKNLQSIKDALVAPSAYQRIARNIFEWVPLIVNQFSRLMSTKKVSSLEGENLEDEYVNSLRNFVEINAPTALVKIQKEKTVNAAPGGGKLKVEDKKKTKNGSSSVSSDKSHNTARRGSGGKNKGGSARSRRAVPPPDKTFVKYSSGLPPNPESPEPGTAQQLSETDAYSSREMQDSVKVNKTDETQNCQTRLLESSENLIKTSSDLSKKSSTEISETISKDEKSRDWQIEIEEELCKAQAINEKIYQIPIEKKAVEKSFPDMLKFLFMEDGVPIFENNFGCLVDRWGNLLSQSLVQQLDLNGRLTCKPYLASVGLEPKKHNLDHKNTE